MGKLGILVVGSNAVSAPLDIRFPSSAREVTNAVTRLAQRNGLLKEYYGE